MVSQEWESGCACSEPQQAGQCVVLDPFFGVGTVGLVALKHHRKYRGIELNADYIDLAQKRLAVVQPVLWSGVDGEVVTGDSVVSTVEEKDA